MVSAVMRTFFVVLLVCGGQRIAEGSASTAAASRELVYQQTRRKAACRTRPI